jgi:plasmid stabilization system protein ParE
MTYRLHIDAEADVQTAADWYEEQREALGDRFLDAIEEAFAVIDRMPRAFTLVSPPQPEREVRRYNVPGFPYTVFYEVRDDEVIVLAVTHQRRRPGAWQTRQA